MEGKGGNAKKGVLFLRNNLVCMERREEVQIFCIEMFRALLLTTSPVDRMDRRVRAEG